MDSMDIASELIAQQEKLVMDATRNIDLEAREHEAQAFLSCFVNSIIQAISYERES
jgi:hypothetical protein